MKSVFNLLLYLFQENSTNDKLICLDLIQIGYLQPDVQTEESQVSNGLKLLLN